MIRLALLLAMLLPATVAAVPVSTEPAAWRPGSAPCDGVCDRDDALADMVEAGILPAEVAERIRSGRVPVKQVTIRDGEVLHGMTWAIDGRPHFGAGAYRAETDGMTLFADAYSVRHGRVVYEVMNVRLCRNWTTRQRWAPPPVMPPSITPPVVRADPTIRVAHPDLTLLPPVILRSPPPDLQTPPPMPPAAIPPPAPAWLLLTAIGALIGARVLRGATHA